MGRYAQQRRRGSDYGPVVGGLPPGKPLLHELAGDLVQDSANLNDYGGQVQLERSDTGVGGWTVFGTDAYQESYDWGPLSGYTGKYLRAREFGNGVQWVGWSVYSDVYGPV